MDDNDLINEHQIAEDCDMLIDFEEICRKSSKGRNKERILRNMKLSKIVIDMMNIENTHS